ncbi:hypothetical protein GGS20DRAFT_198105 [Poronia punctata]|nr:hypothetical protein GGS20DRAFT_198105 [Poronia punctata]
MDSNVKFRPPIIHRILEEEQIGSWSERDPTSYSDISGAGDGRVFQFFEQINNYSLYSELEFATGYDTNRSDLRLLIAADEVERLRLPENSTNISLNITQGSVHNLISYLTQHFFSNGLDQSGIAKPSAIEVFFSRPYVPEIFDNVATSLTNWIRSSSNATLHQGTSLEWVTTVRVEWKYITVPLVSFIAGILFCLLTIWETRRLGLPAWKTGMIATLTHSLDATTRDQLRYASMDGSLEKMVKATVVRLEDTGSGLEMKAKQI